MKSITPQTLSPDIVVQIPVMLLCQRYSSASLTLNFSTHNCRDLNRRVNDSMFGLSFYTNTSLDILRWCIITLPSLYQETSFGLSGLVTLDMLSKLQMPAKSKVDLIFLDTLHHFGETLSLVDRIQTRYPQITLHVYKPQGVDTAEEFAVKYGDTLWQTDEELYDFTVKVEPSERAVRELQIKAVLTGRRKTQGGARKQIDIIEVNESGLIKINPLANWSFRQVEDYIHEHDIPYNELLDRGYKSVGDWHSTVPVAEGEDERAGRWKGRAKSECGIHNPKSRYAQFLQEQAQKEQESLLNDAFERKMVVAL